MECDFQIIDGIYLLKSEHELDLHNNFDFLELHYSVSDRLARLVWTRSRGDWVSEETPQCLVIEFSEVSDFRFMPRDKDKPFTEDDCINSIGFWTDEDWVDGVFTLALNQSPEPHWLMAMDFMSGAVIAIAASKASAKIGDGP